VGRGGFKVGQAGRLSLHLILKKKNITCLF